MLVLMLRGQQHAVWVTQGPCAGSCNIALLLTRVLPSEQAN